MSNTYQGEAMLLRWGETSATGPNVTLQLESVEAFKHLPWGKQNGQRFMVAIVAIDDHEQPVPETEADRAIKKAHAVARDPAFQGWANAGGTDDAMHFIRSRCAVESTTEFRTNPEALKRFEGLMTEYRYKDQL